MLHFASRWGIATLVLVGTPLIAQSSTAGSLAGTVHDKTSGGPLAGVTVKLASAQITRTAVTGVDGSFRFPLLNPGPYVMTLAKGGFATISNQKVDVLVNETKQLNLRMASDLGMVVDVVAAPVVAVDTTSTQSGATMTMESIKALPRPVRTQLPGGPEAQLLGLPGAPSGPAGEVGIRPGGHWIEQGKEARTLQIARSGPQTACKESHVRTHVPARLPRPCGAGHGGLGRLLDHGPLGLGACP